MGKMISELIEEARIKDGAQNYEGHDYMDLARFAEDTRHMIIFDVLSYDARVGDKGDRMRLFLSDIGYEKAQEDERNGNIKIRRRGRVLNGGRLRYDNREQIR